jgi:hypothetical protein
MQVRRGGRSNLNLTMISLFFSVFKWSTVRVRIVVLPWLWLLILVALSTARSRPPDKLSIKVINADPALAEQTVEILNEAHDSMAAGSGVRILDTVTVVYIGRSQSFDSIAGGLLPDWGVGVAISERNTIAIRSPREYPLGEQLRMILRHELAHLHFETIMGHRRPPRWMHEGYAQQFAHQWVFGDDFLIARAVFSDNLIPLTDIDGVNLFRDAKARLAYAQSYLAMGYFLDTYGWSGLMLLARSLRQGGDWDQAFIQSTGTTYAGFQTEYAEFMEDRYNWAAFLGDTILLWIILSIVFVLLYILKRYHSSRKLADWERQEEIEDILYAPFDRSNDTDREPGRDNDRGPSGP